MLSSERLLYHPIHDSIPEIFFDPMTVLQCPNVNLPSAESRPSKQAPRHDIPRGMETSIHYHGPAGESNRGGVERGEPLSKHPRPDPAVPEFQKLNKAAREICATFKELLVSRRGLSFSDGAHFSAKGLTARAKETGKKLVLPAATSIPAPTSGKAGPSSTTANRLNKLDREVVTYPLGKDSAKGSKSPQKAADWAENLALFEALKTPE
ncbi:hypothetical protein B0H67DRAFT_308084 [Lasiosphaeris hirsuta]|uniref:Uncharacterized protein n=1 Tax=Lasiosphaeris hirsuta TaxID=260670 RepID=A0AA40A112_9PEZI|nr:hypothetical protein B0H67DRAFT_308084 [Lasiosphaeris hirsuta]